MMTTSGYYSGNACRQTGKELTGYACLSNLSIEGVSKKAFISRIRGMGMGEAGITDGDWLVFDSCPAPVNGDIVSLIVYGQELCRRVFFESETDKEMPCRVRIRREDHATPDLVADAEDVEIRGVLVGLIRACGKKKKDRTYQYLSARQAQDLKSTHPHKNRIKISVKPPSREKTIKVTANPSMGIQDMGLPHRVTNCLLGIGMKKVQDILDIYDKESMLAIPGLGKAAYESILSTLENEGFDIRHLRW